VYVTFQSGRGLGTLSPNDLLASVSGPAPVGLLPSVDASSSLVWMIAGALAISTLVWWGSEARHHGRKVQRRYRRAKSFVKRIPRIRARSPLYVREND
jgi:hypothetical protein